MDTPISNVSSISVAASKKHVNTKVVDDKLKIIDDVPNSAVEMAVKEKVRVQSNLTNHFYSIFFYSS